MAMATFFLQECPTCGRRLQVRVSLLGREVACPHCHAEFVACLRAEPGHVQSDLMARAEHLLGRASRVAAELPNEVELHN